jgi:NAD+ diphosphatase
MPTSFDMQSISRIEYDKPLSTENIVSFVITDTLPASAQAIWFIWDNAQLLYIDGALPATVDHLPLTRRRAIGEINGTACFSAELIGTAPGHAEWRSMRPAMLDMDLSHQQALSRARQLNLFDQRNRFCSACATPLKDNSHDTGKQCPSCGALYYPPISPAMMVMITRGNELLLARAPHFAEGVYSALAGFVEPGETLEQCVHREAMEEVGVKIGNLRYVNSQQWPFPHSLMLAFTAEYRSGEITPQAGEIEDARWFTADKLPALPSKVSIAWHLIQHTLSTLTG